MFLLLPFLPSCWFSLLACVGFFQALDVFVPVPSLVSLLRSCWRFFFPSVFRLVPFWFPWRFWFWFWWLGSACSLKNSSNPSGALPCGVGGVRGGVVFFSSFLFSFLRVVGWGWLGWLLYYQIQKFPVVDFSVPFVLECEKVDFLPLVQEFSFQEFRFAVQDLLPRNLQKGVLHVFNFRVQRCKGLRVARVQVQGFKWKRKT